MSQSIKQFDQESLKCKLSIGNRLFATSESLGWKSVLVECHRMVPSAETFETHATPDQTIVVMLRGEQRLASCRNGTWRQAVYRAGTVGMTPPGAVDRLRRLPERNPQTIEKANLYIPYDYFEEAADFFRRAGVRPHKGAISSLAFDDPLVAQTAVSLVRAIENNAPDLYAESAVQNLAVHLLSAHCQWIRLESDQRDPGVMSDRRLARVLEFMSAHCAEALTLDVLAKQANLSKYHFARLFRERMGLAPHAYILQLRMSAARRMLVTSDLSVAEIAALCGFRRHAHFSTSFRKRFGSSPLIYRERRVNANS